MKLVIRRVLQLLVFILFLVLLVNAVLNRGGDFIVYWRTARHLLAGEAVYSVQRDGGFCYKYPPWMALPLAPLGFFSLATAAVIWRLLIVGSLFFVWRWTSRMLQSRFEAWIALPLLWGVWVQNVVTGQMTLPLLALALWGFELALAESKPVLGALVTFQALSAKVFHLFAALGFSRKQFEPRAWSAWLKAALICLLASLPALWGFRQEGGAGGVGAPTAMLRAYVEATTSGNYSDLGGGLYGLPVMWARWFGLDPILTRSRLIGFVPSVLLAAVLLWALRRRLKERSSRELYAVALALAGVIHPLTFSYSLAWIYPALAVSIQRIVDRGVIRHNRIASLVWFTGVLFVVFFNTQLSTWFGIYLWEGYPIKAVGTLLICVAMCFVPSRAHGDFQR